MKLKLTKGLDKEEASKVKADFISAAPFRSHFVKVLSAEIELVRKAMEDENLYEKDNALVLVAKKAEKINALKTIISLITEK